MENSTNTTFPALYNADIADLEQLVRTWGQPAFRAKQIYRQIYVNLVADPLAMTDLPLALRQRLAAETTMGSMQLERVQIGDEGLTRKALFSMGGGAVAETVLMVYPDRATVCVSTQAGCAMGCVFCATGKLGLLRNLSTGQIVEQVLWAARELRTIKIENAELRMQSAERGNKAFLNSTFSILNSESPRISNIVFMGMGEPFANYDRWWAAVERIHDPQGYNLGARNMTVSTVGLVKGILRLAEERLPINLAISLHAPDDELRSALMPVNDRYPLAELIDATHTYIERTGRRVSFEYVLMQGRNDHQHQALALAKLLKRKGERSGMALLCHVNLIPWNPIPGMPLGRSERQRVLDFQQILTDYGVACTVRVERGVDIAAACGQLAGAADQHITLTTEQNV